MGTNEEFVKPDFSAPTRLEERVAGIPASATVKGMFAQDIVAEVQKATGKLLNRPKFHPFRDYPYPEWVKLLAEAAQVAYPEVPPAEGLRRLGQRAYGSFVRSLAGKVLFGIVGKDPKVALRLVPQAYKITNNIATAHVAELTEGRAVLEVRGAWDFADSYGVGIFEGGITALERTGEVKLRMLSLCDADYLITWR